MNRHLAVVQHHPVESAGGLRPWAERHGFVLDIFRADMDALPGPWDGPCVLLGGPQSVNAPTAWMEREMSWLRERIARGMPVLGICLGSQLLAAALGANVRPLARPETGWTPIVLEDGSHLDVLQWHEEAFTLPPGGTRLARSESCDVQAFRKGNCTGVQFHPEWDAALVAAINDHFGADSPLPRAVDPERFARVAAWLDGLMATWRASW